jgi:arylsulfatase A-like enzyme
VVRFASRLAPDEVTIAERLRDAGFATVGISANPLLFAKLGWGQGFDVWEIVEDDPEPNGDAYLDAETVGTRALAWLDANWKRGDGPVFLYLHFMEPHAPYTPPEPFRSRLLPPGTSDEATRLANQAIEVFRFLELSTEQATLLSALYDGEIAYLDHALAKLFERLAARGFLDRALVVVTADHGEEFQEHRGWMHGWSLFEEVVRVPLLLLAPDFRGHREVRQPVSLIDVAPTLLELAGLSPEVRFVGRSLTPLLRVGGATPAPIVLELEANAEAGADRRIHAAGLVSDSRKLLVRPDGAAVLFELTRDPGERSPADPAAVPDGAELIELLESTRPARVTRPGPVEPLTEEQRQLLRALGYLND